MFNHGIVLAQEDYIITNFFELQCPKCENLPTFNLYKTFVEHWKTEHQADVFECCNLSLRRPQDMLKHLLEHNPAYSCLECGKTFENATSYSVHSKQHSTNTEPEFACSHCSKQFTTKNSLAIHTNRHLPDSERPHRCQHCSKGFGTKFNMVKHERTHLPEAERLNYVCDICGKRFGYASTLFNHQKHVHDQKRPFACPVCAKTFPIKGALTYHLTTHQARKKVQCDYCGTWLKNEKVLQIHKKIHEGQVHECVVCTKTCSTANNLRSHMLSHSDERPHACLLCQRTFKTLRDLKTHKVQHTGLKPYSCPHCPRTFASPSNFYAHRKTQHTSDALESSIELQQHYSEEGKD